MIKDLDAILVRADELAALETAGRSAVSMAGLSSWPIGDAIRATLADVRNLVDEARKGDAAPTVDPIRAALIGILRADGFVVMGPKDSLPTSAIGDAGCGECTRFAFVDDGDGLKIRAEIEVPCHATTSFDAQEHVLALHPLREGARIEFAAPSPPTAGDLHPLDDGASEALGTVCPKCKGALLSPGGPCRYLDCNKPAEPPADELYEGAFVRFGYGLYEGRQAIIGPKGGSSGLNWTARLLSRHVDVTNPIEITADRAGRPILVDPVDPDAAPAAPVEPAKEDRKRAEEPPKLAIDWEPSPAQIKTFAKDLGSTPERITELVAEFKRDTAKHDPASKLARWGAAFKPWASARLAAPS